MVYRPRLSKATEMILLRHVAVLGILVCLLPSHCNAQAGSDVQIGANGQFYETETHQIDSINLSTLNPTIKIPIFSKPGRGLALNTYLTFNNGGSSFGWHSVFQNLTGIVNYGDTIPVEGRGTHCGEETSGWTYTDTLGIVHYFSNVIYFIAIPQYCTGATTVLSSFAEDGSGLELVITNASIFSGSSPNPTANIIESDGTILTVPSVRSGQPYSVLAGFNRVDPNGNVITPALTGITDTTGETLAISNYLDLTQQNWSGGESVDINQFTAPPPTTYTYTDSNGASQTVTVNYKVYAMQNGGCPYSGPGENFIYFGNLIDSVVLENGTRYTFSYDQYSGTNEDYYYEPSGVTLWLGNYSGPYTTGRITNIELPTGGYIGYTYGERYCGSPDGNMTMLTRTTSDGTTTYTLASSAGYLTPSVTTVVDPAGNTTVYTFSATDQEETKYNLPPFMETSKAEYQGAAQGTPLRLTEYCYVGLARPCSGTAYMVFLGTSPPLLIPYMDKYVSLNGTLVSHNTYKYSSTLYLPTEVDDYDTTGTTVLRKTLTQYWAGNGPPTTKPQSVIVQDGQGNPVAQTTYGYDETSLTATTGIPQHVSVGPSRGNLTSINRWNNISNSWIKTSYTYDDTGNPLSITDPNGNVTSMTYDSTGLYANTVTQPSTSGVQHIDYYNYDVNTGKPTWHTDQNGSSPGDTLHTTNFTYNDPLGRLTKITYPPSSNGQGETDINYNDSAQEATTTLIASPNQNQVSSQINDGYGRVVQSITSDGATAETTYNSLGQVAYTTNPHYATPSSSDGVTSYAYDALGRVIYQCNPDNGTGDGPCVPGSSYKSWIYNANTTTVTDEAGNSTQQIMDGLGRLAQVVEPGSLTTNYSYDVLNNLTGVNQTGNGTTDTSRTRSFIYDSLSRLISSTNPESGTTTYNYDANGNLVQKTSPAPNTSSGTVTLGYCYDALNRVTYKFYNAPDCPASTSSSAPADAVASFSYDSSPISGASNTNGMLTQEMTLSAGTILTQRTPYAYDATGRLLAEQQCPVAPCPNPYTFQYSYDLAGNVIQSNNGLSNSNAASFAYGYDQANRLSSLVSSGSNIPAPFTLLGNPSYGPAGMTGAQLGVASSSAAITMTRGYDNRMRLVSETDQGHVQLVAGSGSHGSIEIQGSEKLTSPATPGAGWLQVIAGGLYRQICLDGTTTCVDISTAAGSLQITIDGFTATANYPSSVNSSTVNSLTIAAAIATALNTSGSPVTASTNGTSSVYIVSKLTGSASNYPFSIDLDDVDLTCSAATNMALAGGLNGSSSPDTGTVTATVSGVPASVSWGAADTAGSIAVRLAAAIQSAPGSQATASAVNNGAYSQVLLTSTGVGAATNGTVPLTVTDTTPGISTPSFVFTPANMTGGTDATTSVAQIYNYNTAGNFAPNGNLMGYTDLNMGQWNFEYDNLNRLTSGMALTGLYQGQSTCWKYDSFGNRLSEAVSNTPCNSSPSPTNWASYNANNQINGYSVPGGVSYDAAGDVTYDGLNQYLYDAEGRICAVENTVAGNMTGYLYDAQGERVAKGTLTSFSCSPGNGFTPTNKYLLGSNGEQATELTVQSGSDTWQHSNVYAGDKLLATYDVLGLHFQLSDWLGTRRVQASSLGTVEETCTNLPFGDQQQCVTFGSATDATEQHFTGKERDTESGLDNFGARYYSSNMGRLQSPDPSGAAFSDPGNPQSWNMYSYVQNNPLNAVDPDGLDCVYIDNDTGRLTGFNRGDCDNSTEAKANSGYYFDGTVNTIYTTTGDTSGQVVDVQGTSDTTGGDLLQTNPAGLSFGQPNASSSTSGMNTTINTWGDFSQTTQFRHGAHAFRDNNQGNIEWGKFSNKHGAIGADGRFGVFTSAGQGKAALDALLHGPTYFHLSIDAAVGVYAPKFENNTAGYQQFLQNVVGVSGNTPLSSLSPSQMSALENGIARYEGATARGNYSISVTTNF